MAIQNLLNEVEELSATVSSMTLTSATEPHQQEWEDEWESLGHSLPITVGTELYWNDGTQLRGMYMAVPDGFTIVVRWSKILDTFEDMVIDDTIPAVRNIWVRWWFDDTHTIGTGIYDGIEGTYKIFMDGTIELITTLIAVTVHSVAGYMIISEKSGLNNLLHLYDLATDTIGPIIDSMANLNEPQIYGPTYPPDSDTEPVDAGWGFFELFSWADETDPVNLDFYYGSGNDIHFYEHGIGESTLFSLPRPHPAVDYFNIVTVCFQNNLLAVSNRISGGAPNEVSIYLATIFDLNGVVIFELGISGEDISEDPDAWGADLYRAWHFRKTESSTTLIDVLKPEPPVRYGRDERYDAAPSGQMEDYGTHTWEKYLRYDTVDNRYLTNVIYDLRLTNFQNLGNELVIVPSDTTTAPDVVINNRHRWAASLISDRKQCYTFIRTSPSGANLLLGWGEAFGIKSKAQDKLTQGDALYGGQELPTTPKNRPVLESGRHGAIVLALNSEYSTGRVYHITDYIEPSPTEMVIYSAELAEDSDTIAVDLTDIIATLDEDYEILKVYIETAGPDVNSSMSIDINDALTGDNRSWKETGTGTSSLEHNGLWHLYVGGDISSWVLTFHNFRSNDTYLTMFAEGGTRGSVNVQQQTSAGYIDTPGFKPLVKLAFTADSGNFNAGNRVVITVLRTRGKYSNGGQNDYRMA